MTHEPNLSPRPFSPMMIAGLAFSSAVAQLLPRPGNRIRMDPAATSPLPAEPWSPSRPPLRPQTEVKTETLFEIVRNIGVRVGKDNILLVAAGCAFYAMTAIFPAIAAFVSIFGLFADPHTVHQQIEGFSKLLPPEALKLLTDAVDSYVGTSRSTLNVALLISVALALWTAKAGVASLMTGLNIANEQLERRGFIRQQIVGLSLTFGAIVLAAVAFAAVALLPAIIGFLPISQTIRHWLEFGRWPLLALVIAFGLAILYRFGPSRENPRWRWITWGAAVATILWLIGSAAFSFYVSNFGSYDKTYGSLAAPVLLLLWFWVSAVVVLLGAEVDAELSYADGRQARPVDPSKTQ